MASIYNVGGKPQLIENQNKMNTFMSDMSKKEKGKINTEDVEKFRSWSSYLESTKERANYSIRRMDLLTISITGAGLYIIFETLKFFKANDVQVENSGLILFCGMAFLISICTNFISQITGFYANDFEEKYIQLVLEDLKNNDFSECDIKRYNTLVKGFNTSTKILNIVSVSTMFLGLIGLFIYYYLYLS